jgi:hypothetical protein
MLDPDGENDNCVYLTSKAALAWQRTNSADDLILPPQVASERVVWC